MGVAWYDLDVDKPIMLMFPGIDLGVNNLYTDCLAQKLRSEYRVGIALFRCSGDLPVTSFKVTCAVSVQDAKEMIDYVCDTHSPQEGIFVYGASLGAILLG